MGPGKVTFRCECGQKLHALEANAGREFSCPECNRTVIVPGGIQAVAPIEEIIEAPPARMTIDPALESAIQKSRIVRHREPHRLSGFVRQLRGIVFQAFLPIVIVLLCIHACQWWGSWERIGYARGYISTVAACLLIALSFRRRVLGQWQFPAALLVGIGLCVLMHKTGTYRETWTNKDGINYFDFYTRSGQIYDRTIWSKDFMHSGPMAGNTKPHGEWDIRDDLKFSKRWYWYGEEISEGEWHLRNK